jgi:hypothetical protein
MTQEIVRIQIRIIASVLCGLKVSNFRAAGLLVTDGQA